MTTSTPQSASASEEHHAVVSPDSSDAVRSRQASGNGLERVLGFFSVVTMVMTVPQVLTIWIGHNAGGVSLVSWAAYFVAACLWFVHGLQTGDKTIYLPCVGWMLLDLAVVIGVLVYS
jgi:uncharacterized protein with PQ loop repeat